MAKACLIIVAMCLMDFSMGFLFVPAEEWAEYKSKYEKTYSNSISENFARLYYAVNKRIIERHNHLYDRGSQTYKLAINQFTDMHFKQFSALFPLATTREVSNDKPAPVVQPAATSFDPRLIGYNITVEDQGTKCNSGWAYAGAKCMELFKAHKKGDMNPASLSAQNFIDCAGQSIACRNQEPLAAFNYLTKNGMVLHLESNYENLNNQSQAGMCTPPNNGQNLGGETLKAYSKITNGDDEAIKKYVYAGMPVVVEVNPSSFEFMHYSSGIFKQRATGSRSHFMVVIGFNTDPATGLDYWILINSFGTTWGKDGFLQLHRSASTKLSKNAIFPSD